MLNTIENTYLWLLLHILSFKNETAHKKKTSFCTITKQIFQKSIDKNEIEMAYSADLHFCILVNLFQLIQNKSD